MNRTALLTRFDDRDASLTLRALAALLAYPDAPLRQALGEIDQVLQQAGGLSQQRKRELARFTRQLAGMDPYDAETRYVETFDRGHATSLHLFEHVHGDSRERGPAMTDLMQTYEKAGLMMTPGELPDHLGVLLEFASTQPRAVARDMLAEVSHILNQVLAALAKRDSPYTSLIAAVLEFSGEAVQALSVADDPPIDEAWAEPPAFDGCSTRGQASPDGSQAIHFVRRPAAAKAGDTNQGVRP